MICDDCGISRTAFYNYFTDKYAVLEEIENTILTIGDEVNKTLIYADLSSCKRGEPFPHFFEICSKAFEHKKYFKPLIGPNGDQHFISRWKKNIQKDIRKKLIYDKIKVSNLDAVTSFLASGVVGIFTYWFYDAPNLSILEISEMAGRLVFGEFYEMK